MSYNKGGGGLPRGFGYAGFVFPKKDSPHAGAAIPPPSSGFKSVGTGLSKQGYSTMSAISQNALSAQTSWGAHKKRSKTEDEYFEEEEEVGNSNCLEYIPAPGSPSYQGDSGGKKGNESDSDDDPLDAFMEGIDQQFKKDLKNAERSAEMCEKGEAKKGIRDDIDEEDNEESYYRYMEENPLAGVQQDDSDIELEYDEDGNPIAPVKSKEIDPLPPIDHSTVEYADFEKNFYCIHPEIAALTKQQLEDLRNTLSIKVTGAQPPNPVVSFAHFGFDDPLMKSIRKSEYTQPTAIQAQGVPAALAGRDIIGIAKTGSGKTAAFVWPMLVHIMDQKELGQGDGPIGLILAPTRELSQQIYNEARKFGKVYNIQVVCCYGGGSKWEQSKALEGGAEVVVATPGRMIDLVKMKATNLSRVTFLVLDEADRMFDMGFEPQVRSICNHVRPDRQTLMFSATFKKKVEKLARDVLSDPVRIVQGDVGGANEDIEQTAVVLDSQQEKMMWLVQNLVKLLSVGSLLIFTAQKLHAEELANSLKVKEYDCALLHGDLDQAERNKVITAFKRQEVPILVATDVAARGLDIPHIKTVVNYHVARDMDTHTHRIGRTGRAGEKGYAYTLVTKEDKELAGHLVRSLEGVNQSVPVPLMNLALQSVWFRKSRFKGGKGKQLNIGGSGLGFRERPGLGTEPVLGPGASMAGVSATAAAADAMKRCGPGSDRLSAMKEAFKSQYASQFKASSDHTWEHTRDHPGPDAQGSTGEPSKKRNRKSRWEDS